MRRAVVVAVLAGTFAVPAAVRAQCPDGTPPPCRGARGRAPAAASVAVLDFDNLSRDTGDIYLTDGLADELTSRLGQVGRLTVASRTTVRRLHNASEMPTADLGRQLNVAYLVHGSLRRAGGRLRVTAELLRATTGAIAWSSQYDESARDLLAIQEAVATAVATAVVGQLLPSERNTLAARPTRDPAAYDEYLRAREHYRRAGTTAEALLAVNQLQHVISLDSTFAGAWALLSTMHSLVFWNYWDRTAERLALARAAAERAAMLAPNDPASHIAMGYYYYWGGRDYARALQEFSAALVANPHDAEVHAAIANVARRQGSWDQSLASRDRALALDPLNAGEFEERGITELMLRRLDDAQRDFERAIAIDPHRFVSWGWLALTSLARGGTARPALLDSVAAYADSLPAAFLINFAISLPLWRAPGPHQGALLRASRGASPADGAAWFLKAGQVLRSRDSAAAVRLSDSLLAIAGDLLSRNPDDDELHSLLSYAYLGLGRCGEALGEARRAAQLMPVARDALTGPQRIQALAEVEGACGQSDSALTHLTQLLGMPSILTRPLVRADPAWAPLRSDPRFLHLVAER